MPNVRISQRTHTLLKEIAAESGQSIQHVLDDLVEAHRRRSLLEATNEAFAALKADRDAWAKEQAERRAWDVTLADGLDNR